MKTAVKYFSAFLFTVLLLGCTKDFVVKNIKNSTINIISPVDNLSTPNNSIIFWWDEVDGAEKYNLQIVKPSFTAVAQLLVDTNVTGTKFNYTFTPGTYQWRIKAVNAGGSTVYSTRTLTIDTTSNLAYGVVNPISPISNFKTANKTVTFSWNSLNAATSYNIMLSDASGQIATLNTVNTSTVYTFPSDGTYSWKVQAQNAFSFSQYNVSRYLKIDGVAPTAPGLSSPTNNTLVKDSIYLKWVRNSSDVMYDSLFISTDSFASQLRNMKVSDVKLQINTINPSLTTNSYYFWRLKSIDSIGNVSPNSVIRKFKLIP